ncbi:hypothetical protein [Streptomyces asoensis]|uniref:hypothetical protein n=1 Tax=Streptomyces asoensis TaxID=249586 RepID=UPI003F4D275D
MSIGRLPDREQRILDEMERVLRRDRRFQRRLRRLSRSALVLPSSPRLRASGPGPLGDRGALGHSGRSGLSGESGLPDRPEPSGHPDPSGRPRLFRRRERTRPRPAFHRYPRPWTMAVLLALSVTLMVYGITTSEPGVIWAFAAVWPLTLYTAFRLLCRQL